MSFLINKDTLHKIENTKQKPSLEQEILIVSELTFSP